MSQQAGESIREYITRLKICALDCDFCCPFDTEHDLTEYHIVNKLRCGILDTQLQQELLQKSTELNTIELMTNYCENFECAKNDRDRLHDDKPSICCIETIDMTNEEVIAAISSYKRSKNIRSKGGRRGFEKHEIAKCPAQGKKCTKCNELNHFATQCTTRVNDIKDAA